MFIISHIHMAYKHCVFAAVLDQQQCIIHYTGNIIYNILCIYYRIIVFVCFIP
jgi:hypothetical protein